MKKKALVLAIAGALSAPSAWAATDTSGMQFTSASEGFYASIRVRYVSGRTNDSGADLENASSRFGVRGTNDLGGGLTGFYQYEAEVGINDRSGSNPLGTNESALATRLAHVGLRGDFGEVVAGSFWTNDYNWTHGSTDQANTQSGWLNYGADRPGRTDKSVQYTTPDLNGFQGALRIDLEDEATDNGGFSGNFTANGTKDKNDVDSWNIAGVYNIQGFTVGGAYNQRPDALNTSTAEVTAVNQVGAPGQANYVAPVAFRAATTSTDDASSWTIRLGYGQDNWNVNGWYGEDNTSEVEGFDDTELFSLHAGVAIDKVNLYGIYETSDNGNDEDTYGTIGVQYSLGAQTRTWIEYAAIDLDGTPAADDYVNIGLRHDF